MKKNIYIRRSMYISPSFTIDDWRCLDLNSDESGWDTAIRIFTDRINGRFIRVADHINRIRRDDFTGFAVLALDCLLVETIQQFRDGLAETSRRGVEHAFICFLTTTSFKRDFTTEGMAKKFYDDFRCGILHQAEVKGSSLLRTHQQRLVIEIENGEGLILDGVQFHERLVKVFNEYVETLRVPSNVILRHHFRRKMDYICRNIPV